MQLTRVAEDWPYATPTRCARCLRFLSAAGSSPAPGEPSPSWPPAPPDRPRVLAIPPHRTEGIPITLIGFLRNFSAPVHVGHAAPHSAPLQVVLRAAFCGPVGFEHFYVLGEGLDAKQVAHGSAGFAVTLQGIAVDTVFDPVPAGAA